MASFFELFPPLVPGLIVTVKIAAAGSLLALAAAFIAGLARLSRWSPVRFLAVAYIDLFRGTSALVQLFWFYFALPMLGIQLEAMTAGILVLGLNHGAYGAEIVRGAVRAVPIEQYEATAALNFSPGQAMLRIIFPQALLSMVPPFGNLFIELLKNTALVSMITLSDLTFQAQILRSATLESGKIFLMVLILYFIMAFSITLMVRRFERWLAVGQDYGGVH